MASDFSECVAQIAIGRLVTRSKMLPDATRVMTVLFGESNREKKDGRMPSSKVECTETIAVFAANFLISLELANVPRAERLAYLGIVLSVTDVFPLHRVRSAFAEKKLVLKLFDTYADVLCFLIGHAVGSGEISSANIGQLESWSWQFGKTGFANVKLIGHPAADCDMNSVIPFEVKKWFLEDAMWLLPIYGPTWNAVCCVVQRAWEKTVYKTEEAVKSSALRHNNWLQEMRVTYGIAAPTAMFALKVSRPHF